MMGLLCLMAPVLAQCHRARWLQSLAEKPGLWFPHPPLSLPPQAILQGGEGSVGSIGPCPLRRGGPGWSSCAHSAPSPFLLFSPSLPFKGRKIDLMTNRRERQSAAACCPLRPPPSPFPCSGPPQDIGLGAAEAGDEGWIVSHPASLPYPSDPWSQPLGWG